MKYHYILIRASEIKNNEKPNIGEDTKQLYIPSIAGGSAKWYATLENNLVVLKKLSLYLHMDTAISFLGIYPREMKT